LSSILKALGTGEVLRGILAGTYTETETGTGVDVSGWDGVAIAILDSSAMSADDTLDVKLQTCATVDGTYADITGATFTQVDDTAGGSTQVIAFDVSAAEAFVLAVGTIAGTTTSGDFCVTFFGIPKVA